MAFIAVFLLLLDDRINDALTWYEVVAMFMIALAIDNSGD